MSEIKVLKVSKNSVPNKVASAIIGNVKDGFDVQVQGIGAASINQAIKSIAVANDFSKEESYYFTGLPKFVEVEIEGQERTAINITIEKRDK